MKIILDDLRSPEIANLLREHLADMVELSPPESIHALDLDDLRQPEITFWSVWDNGELLGCGALKKLSPGHGEIKSMRTATAHLRNGVATKLLQHILDEAHSHGYRRISLETGSQPGFQAARSLYARFGFTVCEPFANYVDDPNSVFMTKLLREEQEEYTDRP